MEANLEAAVLGRIVDLQAENDPERLVFVFENHRLPAERVYGRDLAIHANQLACELRAGGFRKGDPVAVMLRNHPEFVYALAANSKLGLPTVPIDPRARGDKLYYLLTFTGCAGLITADYVVADEGVADIIKRAGARTYVVSTPEGRARGIDVPTGWRILNEVLEGPERGNVGQQVDDIGRPWLLAYTSGTTGAPKAIVFTYERLLFYRLVPQFFGYRQDDIPYTGLSLSHGNALVVTMMPAIWGAVDHSVFSRWFTKTRLWDICIDYGCTTWSNLGGMATAIYSQAPSPKDRAHKVRRVISAGMPREIWEHFAERFGVEILEWYGTMEGGFACNPVNVGPVGSFGKPPEGLLEMKVIKENDRPAEPGEIGELVVRPAGRAASVTYHRNPDASANKARGGWLRTGDMCWRDERGWFYFAYRGEEGGLRKMGEFVSEGFIRRVLAESPDVLDVHVYGIPARNAAPGETDIVAALMVRDKAHFDVGLAFRRCARNLERSHVPDFIQLVDAFPKTASEKVQNRLLVEGFDLSRPYVFARPQKDQLAGDTGLLGRRALHTQVHQCTGQFLRVEQLAADRIEPQPFDPRYVPRIRLVHNKMLNEAGIELGYAFWRVCCPFSGQQAPAGTRVMEDGRVSRAATQHDGRHRNAARCSAYRLNDPVQGEDGANARHRVARSENDGMALAEGVEACGRARPARDPHLPDRRASRLLHVPLLKLQHSPVLEDNMRPARFVAGRNHLGFPGPQPMSEFPGRFRQRHAGTQQVSPQQVEAEIQVSDVEPGRRVKSHESVTNAKGLVAPAPAGPVVPDSRQGVEDRIHIRANAQAEPGEVIAHIDDDAQVTGRNGLAQRSDQPGTPETSGQEHYTRKHRFLF
jgi:acyl-CoA synthetase (AMP-forming)/AMP-acid ligase II